jgi:hypothetical protein
MREPLTPKVRVPRDWEARLLARLTERDVEICEQLYEHRVLTTEQIRQLHFGCPGVARRRLRELVAWGVLSRFQPYRYPGSAPCHYVLGELGVRVVAAAQDLPPREVRARRERIVGLAKRRKLDHLLAVNGFFTALAGAGRADGEVSLTRWWGERRCLATWGDLVAADGFGVLEGQARSLRFHLELDRGTEEQARLVSKVARYEHLRALGETDAVLFCFTRIGREDRVAGALRSSGVVVATTTYERHIESPLGAVWRDGHGGVRARLLDLGSPAMSRGP